MKIFEVLPPSFTSSSAVVSTEEAVGGMVGAVVGFGAGLLLFGPGGGVLGLVGCSTLLSTLGHYLSLREK